MIGIVIAAVTISLIHNYLEDKARRQTKLAQIRIEQRKHAWRDSVASTLKDSLMGLDYRKEYDVIAAAHKLSNSLRVSMFEVYHPNYERYGPRFDYKPKRRGISMIDFDVTYTARDYDNSITKNHFIFNKQGQTLPYFHNAFNEEDEIVFKFNDSVMGVLDDWIWSVHINAFEYNGKFYSASRFNSKLRTYEKWTEDRCEAQAAKLALKSEPPEFE